jgi:hypothetical protein
MRGTNRWRATIVSAAAAGLALRAPTVGSAAVTIGGDVSAPVGLPIACDPSIPQPCELAQITIAGGQTAAPFNGWSCAGASPARPGRSRCASCGLRDPTSRSSRRARPRRRRALAWTPSPRATRSGRATTWGWRRAPRPRSESRRRERQVIPRPSGGSCRTARRPHHSRSWRTPRSCMTRTSSGTRITTAMATRPRTSAPGMRAPRASVPRARPLRPRRPPPPHRSRTGRCGIGHRQHQVAHDRPLRQARRSPDCRPAHEGHA